MNSYRETDHSIRNAESLIPESQRPKGEHRIRGSEPRKPNPESRDPNTVDQTPKPEASVKEPEERAYGKVMAVVEDLFFLAKIREAANHSCIDLDAARPEQVAGKLVESRYSIVIVDLNHRSGRAIEVLDLIKKNPVTRKVPVLGFLSHVQGDLASAARASACDTVIARSAFSQRLAEILSAYCKVSEPITSGIARH
jgi:CheY-like chemotaxis protein